MNVSNNGPSNKRRILWIKRKLSDQNGIVEKYIRIVIFVKKLVE